MIPHRRWNAIALGARANRVASGPGLDVAQGPDGQVVSAGPPPDPPPHPWAVRPRWVAGEDGEMQWEAVVEPGFVNGRDPIAGAGRLADGAPIALGPWRNPASAQLSGAAQDGDFLEYGPAEGYPAALVALGAEPPSQGRGGAQEPDPARTRAIRACDIVLATPRPVVSVRVDLENALDSARNYSVGYAVDSGDYGRPGEVYAVARHDAASALDPLAVLLGSWGQDARDRLKLATVYMLGPAGTAGADGDPDGGWVPAVRHFVFWNLSHAARHDVPLRPPQAITFNTPLGLGLAQSIANAYLQPGNDAYAGIVAALNAVNYAGRHWTS